MSPSLATEVTRLTAVSLKAFGAPLPPFLWPFSALALTAIRRSLRLYATRPTADAILTISKQKKK